MTPGDEDSRPAPFDIEMPIRSESVVLALSEGDIDLHVRLCRYPTAGISWIWAHVELGDEQYGYSCDGHRCSPETVATDAADAVYAATDVPCLLWRHGPRDVPDATGASVELPFHLSPHPPNAAGEHRIRVDARFVPGALAAAPGAGRSELRGRAEATVWMHDGRRIHVAGHGHWHEQHQDEPRFRAAFTYIDLHNHDTEFVAIRGARGGRGLAQRRGQAIAIVAVEVGEKAPKRAIRVELADGTIIEGVARSLRERSVSIYGLRRPSADVVVEGTDFVGTINDWDPDAAGKCGRAAG